MNVAEKVFAKFIKLYTLSTIAMTICSLYVNATLNKLLMWALAILPNWLWQFWWNISIHDWMHVNIYAGDKPQFGKFQLKWLFYYSLYEVGDKQMLNTTYFTNLLYPKKTKHNGQILELNHNYETKEEVCDSYQNCIMISYAPYKSYNIMYLDLVNKRFSRYSSNENSPDWHPILFGRIEL